MEVTGLHLGFLVVLRLMIWIRMPSWADIYQDGRLLFLPMSNSSQIPMQGFCLLSSLEMLQLSPVGGCECSRRSAHKEWSPLICAPDYDSGKMPSLPSRRPRGKSGTLLSQACVHTFEHCTRHVHREYRTPRKHKRQQPTCSLWMNRPHPFLNQTLLEEREVAEIEEFHDLEIGAVNWETDRWSYSLFQSRTSMVLSLVSVRITNILAIQEWVIIYYLPICKQRDFNYLEVRE